MMGTQGKPSTWTQETGQNMAIYQERLLFMIPSSSILPKLTISPDQINQSFVSVVKCWTVGYLPYFYHTQPSYTNIFKKYNSTE